MPDSHILPDIIQPVRPDADCADCHGSGWITEARGRRECNCVLKQRALQYLTPTYADAKYMRNFVPTAVRGNNILIAGASQAAYKSLIKSYLLNTGMTLKHRTVTAYEVMQAYLTNSERGDFSALASVDLLILYLAHDPHNRSYANVLGSLIERRDFERKDTWIYTPHKITDSAFTHLYSDEFAKWVATKFTQMSTERVRVR